MTAPLRLLLSTSLLLTVTAASSLVIVAESCARPAGQQLAMRYTPPKPPSRRAPGTNRAAGSRDCLATDPDIKDPTLKNLTALVPETTYKEGAQTKTQVWGRTTSAQPTLWFYYPYVSETVGKVEFILQDSQDQDLYREPVSVPSSTGLVSIKLPAKVALKPGKMYHWYFKVLGKDCGGQEPRTAKPGESAKPDVSAKPSISAMLNEPSVPDMMTIVRAVDGWIEYAPPTVALAAQLKQAPLQKQALLYAENGFWYNAVNALAELKQTTPSETSITEDWQTLLEQGGLGTLASQPVVKCCTAK
jgi:Domain of Unknown Function (DUF928)